MTPKMDLDVAAEVFAEVDDILNGENIQYSLICGTALGAYHLNGFIPGDRDIDLMTIWEDKDWAWLSVCFQDEDFEVKAIHLNGETYALKLTKRDIHIDLTGWQYCKTEEHGHVRFVRSRMEDYALVQPAHIMESSMEIRFLDRVVRVPHPIEEYLRNEYHDPFNLKRGDDCGPTKSKSRVYGWSEGRQDRYKGEYVYAPGVYDLLHVGHLEYLQKSRQYGSVIAGVQSDDSVEQQKGHPPTITWIHRMRILNALRYVDGTLRYDDLDHITQLKKLGGLPILTLACNDTSEHGAAAEKWVFEAHGQVHRFERETLESTTAIRRRINGR